MHFTVRDKNKIIKTNKHWRINSSKPFQHFLSTDIYSVKMQPNKHSADIRVSDLLSIDVPMPSAQQ